MAGQDLFTVLLVLLSLAGALAAPRPAGYKFLPLPGTPQARKLFDDPATPAAVKRLYVANLIARTPADKIKPVLTKLISPSALNRMQRDPEWLFANPEQIVPYLTSLEKDEVMILISKELQGMKVDLQRVTPKQRQQLDKAFEDGRAAAWISKRFGANADDRKESAIAPWKPPAQPKLTPAQQALYRGPYPKPASGRGTIKVSSPPLTLPQQLTMVQPWNPKSGVTGPNYGRLLGFTPVVVPVVFQLAGFQEEDGTYLPPYNWWADSAAANLIKNVNRLYRGSGFQFKLQQVRWDPRRYPYLNLGNLVDWQNMNGKQAGALIAANNVRGHVINVWVLGSFEGPFKCTEYATICRLRPSGYTPPGPAQDASWKPGSEDNPGQYTFINYDRFSPDGYNNARSYQGGAVSLGHEIAHYFGLLHVHEPGNSCKGTGDAVSDTSPAKEPGDHFSMEWWYEVSAWCKAFRAGKNPSPAPLKKMTTCPGSPPDNVFNIMSYMDDACRMSFTENQVARMQWATMMYRPKFMTANSVKSKPPQGSALGVRPVGASSTSTSQVNERGARQMG